MKSGQDTAIVLKSLAILTAETDGVTGCYLWRHNLSMRLSEVDRRLCLIVGLHVREEKESPAMPSRKIKQLVT